MSLGDEARRFLNNEINRTGVLEMTKYSAVFAVVSLFSASANAACDLAVNVAVDPLDSGALATVEVRNIGSSACNGGMPISLLTASDSAASASDAVHIEAFNVAYTPRCRDGNCFTLGDIEPESGYLVAWEFPTLGSGCVTSSLVDSFDDADRSNNVATSCLGAMQPTACVIAESSVSSKNAVGDSVTRILVRNVCEQSAAINALSLAAIQVTPIKGVIDGGARTLKDGRTELSIQAAPEAAFLLEAQADGGCVVLDVHSHTRACF